MLPIYVQDSHMTIVKFMYKSNKHHQHELTRLSCAVYPYLNHPKASPQPRLNPLAITPPFKQDLQLRNPPPQAQASSLTPNQETPPKAAAGDGRVGFAGG